MMPIERARPEAPVVWTHDEQRDGLVVFRIGRCGESFVAEWPNIARLTCNPDGTRVRVARFIDARNDAFKKLRGVIRALVSDLRGGLALHASAVALDSSAVLVLGRSGSGKSTAAAGLCARNGGHLLADDAATLEDINGMLQVVPSESHHFLADDSRVALGIGSRVPAQTTANKVAVRAPSGRRPVPLALVVALRFDDSLETASCRRIGGAEAALNLLGSVLRFDLENRDRELDMVMRLHRQVAMYEIARPRIRADVSSRIASLLEGIRGQ